MASNNEQIMIKEISNVSNTLIVNIYECFYYGDNQSIVDCQHNISKKYNSKNLLSISRKISQTIKTEVLHESSHNFSPFGDSGSLLIQADLNLYNSATLHLKESHITFHTYIENIYDNFVIVRLEYHISSCSNANVYNALQDLILIDDSDYSLPDMISIDFIRRGAKYGQDHNDIIYDKSPENFDKFSMYRISSIASSINTSNHILLLDDTAMLKKFQLDNSFFQADSIHALKSFLLLSYCNHEVDLESFDIKTSN